MWGRAQRFFSRKTSYDQSRFEAAEELVHLNELIKELHKREVILATAATKNGAQSIDYAKHAVLQKLMHDIDAKINIFNEGTYEKPSKDEAEEIQEKMQGDELEAISNLLEELIIVVNEVLNDKAKKDTLGKARNNDRENASTMVKTGLYGTAFAGTLLVPVTLFVTVPAAYFGARTADKKVREATGLDNAMTRSFELVLELSKTLEESQKNITTKLMGMNRRIVMGVK